MIDCYYSSTQSRTAKNWSFAPGLQCSDGSPPNGLDRDAPRGTKTSVCGGEHTHVFVTPGGGGGLTARNGGEVQHHLTRGFVRQHEPRSDIGHRLQLDCDGNGGGESVSFCELRVYIFQVRRTRRRRWLCWQCCSEATVLGLWQLAAWSGGRARKRKSF